jgi:hypothetical protein
MRVIVRTTKHHELYLALQKLPISLDAPAKSRRRLDQIRK